MKKDQISGLHTKPCYYCKSTWLDEGYDVLRNYTIRCMKCGTELYCKDKEKAILRWNEKYERAYE